MTLVIDHDITKWKRAKTKQLGKRNFKEYSEVFVSFFCFKLLFIFSN